MTPVKGRIRFAMALAIVSAALALAALAGLAMVVQSLITAPAQWPWGWMSLVLGCTVGAYMLRLHAFNRSHYAAFHLETVLRTQLAAHMAKMPLGEVERWGAGALAKVMHEDVKELHAFVADSTPLYARAYAAPAITLALLFWLDWRLALAALAVPVLGFAVLGMIIGGSKDLQKRYHDSRERVAAAVVEFVQAMPVVRTFDSGSATFGRYQQALAAYRDLLQQWYESVGFSARFSVQVLSPLPTLTVLLWAGAWWLAQGSLSFPVWLGVLLLGAGLAEAVMPVMSLYHLIVKAKLSITRIHEVLASPVLPQPEATAARVPQDASVAFENVTFAYTEEAGEVLSEVSFTAAPGSVTALVGPSGAGKTTVARLIPRFWDVTSGRILVGGVDVREMSSDALMGQVAFVFQDTFLFADSIANNIRLGLPEATQQEIEAAARTAQAHDFIKALPAGYDTLAGERGAFLSGGQRQRITIARAILQNRPILVLDEATAFADPENEAALVAALSALMRGKTVIMVAHRLSTIRDADQILVFDQGRLAERGSHEDLLNMPDGVYARLWASYQQAQNWMLPSIAISGEPT
ncbi:ABC transporter ATP-binding protein [Ottowia testudinis]|uniref:ABC transporter ATP-binding protein n=2 Tax=Ottowia testudinis TaxID=2816950 RepID=A0A975CJN0_9BURK|nr:ABC transporter ATP-binding protein [Ottowia testudinis]